MSFANYSPDFRVQSVANLVGDIDIPATPDDALIVETDLIQTALGAEIPLVLGEGTWAINARCALNPANNAQTYQYFQTVLYVDANIVASTAPIFGGGVLGAGGVALYITLQHVIYIPPGATKSLTYRSRSNGNSAIIEVTGGFSNIVATKLS